MSLFLFVKKGKYRNLSHEKGINSVYDFRYINCASFYSLLFLFFFIFITMAAVASSSSKGFPFTQHKSTLQFEELISEIPFLYSNNSIIDDYASNKSNATNFRSSSTIVDSSTAIYLNDPELYMGDDCDTLYQDTLLNSNLLQLLTNDIDGFTKNHQELDVNIFNSPEKHKAHQRLGMLLAHVNTSYSTPSNNKGKGVDRN
jgi:hypothetical protein